jgi:hypothetical protein
MDFNAWISVIGRKYKLETQEQNHGLFVKLKKIKLAKKLTFDIEIRRDKWKKQSQ